MRRFCVFVFVLLAAVGSAAQSDCSAPYCGQIVIPGADAGEWATALEVHIIAEGDVYIRARYGPADGQFAPDPVFVTLAGGDWAATVPDVVSFLWPGLDSPGTLILDWAAYDPAEVYGSGFNVAGGYWTATGASRLSADLLGPDCYTLPNIPGRTFTVQIFNPWEDFAQTFTVDGAADLALASTILDPVSNEFVAGAGSEVCIGIEPPILPPGVNLNIPLFVAVEARGSSTADRFPSGFLDNPPPP